LKELFIYASLISRFYNTNYREFGRPHHFFSEGLEVSKPRPRFAI